MQQMLSEISKNVETYSFSLDESADVSDIEQCADLWENFRQEF